MYVGTCFTKTMQFKSTKNFVFLLDSKDPLSSYRDKFYIPKQKNGQDVIYFAGNSLGLQPKSVRNYIEQELKDWEKLGVEGHLKAKNPWIPYNEFLTEQTAEIVGAKPVEVINMNALTVNLHLLLVSFYRPTPSRHKILIESNAFPSDNYAVKSQIKFHGFNISDSLIVLQPRSNETFLRIDDIEEIISKEGDSIALVWLPGINYYTGQAFEIDRITKAAHSKGCCAGFDLAHAAGNIILKLHNWNVDFAVWCNYKYLNGGPGAIGGAYVHEKYLKNKKLPKFTGWWGHNKKTRFIMPADFDPIPTVESWQVSNPPILQMAALRASLDIFHEVGMERLREKSELLTAYLEFLINRNRNENIKIITPHMKEKRGAQLSLRITSNGKELHKKLIDNGIICDWREPDVIRVAPVPLYNTFSEVYNFVEILFK